MNNIQSLQELLRSNGIFERFGLTRIGVFGSYAGGEKYNDIDLLIEDDLDYEKREELKQLLEEKLHTKIDIVIKKFAEPIILKRAMKDMQYATGY